MMQEHKSEQKTNPKIDQQESWRADPTAHTKQKSSSLRPKITDRISGKYRLPYLLYKYKLRFQLTDKTVVVPAFVS